MWLENATVLSTEALEDADAHMPPHRIALLKAQLAALWWKQDEKRARAWLDAGRSAVAHVPKNESEEDAARRLNTAILICTIAQKLDPRLSSQLRDELISQLLSIVSNAKTEEAKNLLNPVTLRLAYSPSESGETDTSEENAKITRVLMKLNTSQALMGMFSPLLNIYAHNAKLGNQVLGEVLDSVGSGQLSTEALGNLYSILFPNETAIEPPKVAADLRQRYLDMVAAIMTQAAANGPDEKNCYELSPFAMVLSRYPDDMQQRMKPAFDACKPFMHEGTKGFVDEGLRGLNTSDDYQRAAENSTDPAARARLKERAASLLMNKDPERGLDILNGMSDDEQKHLPTDITTTREILEGSAASRLLRAKNYAGLQRLIDRSPKPAETALHIASMASSDDLGYAQTLLPEIRKLLDQEPNASPFFYYTLVRTFSRLSRPEAPAVLRQSIKSVESVPEFVIGEQKSPKEEGIVYSSFWSELAPAAFPDLLDVIDQRMMRAEIDQMKYTGERASMRLWLLRGELKAYQEALKAEAERKASLSPATNAH